MGSWRFLVDFALPIPLFLVFLLLLPAPRWFTRGTLKFVEKTLGLEFFHTFRLVHVMLFIAAMAFLGATRNTYSIYQNAPTSYSDDTPNALFLGLGKRWRSERNFWISFFNFTMWIILARLYVLVKHHEQAIDRLKAVSPAPPSSRSQEAATLKTDTPAAPSEPKKIV